MGYTFKLDEFIRTFLVGILVDDAIVVLENIYRHMEMGKSKIRAAYDGAAEIGFYRCCYYFGNCGSILANW